MGLRLTAAAALLALTVTSCSGGGSKPPVIPPSPPNPIPALCSHLNTLVHAANLISHHGSLDQATSELDEAKTGFAHDSRALRSAGQTRLAILVQGLVRPTNDLENAAATGHRITPAFPEVTAAFQSLETDFIHRCPSPSA